MFVSDCPDMLKKWDYSKNSVSPDAIRAQSKKKFFWVCPISKGEWEASAASVYSLKSASPFVSGQKVLQGFNDLATTHPELAQQWHPTKNGELTPEMVTSGSHKKVHWVCPVSQGEWEDSPSGRLKNGRVSSPFTQGRKIKVGFNDLATTHPELAQQWHPTKNGELTPEMVTSGSNKKVWWTCSESQGEWEASISNRCKGTLKSPFSQGKSVLKGFNDLATTHPELSQQWHPTKNGELTPEMVTSGSNKKVWWTCGESQGEWKASPNERVNQTKTPFIQGKKIKVGFNDLATTHPEIAAQWHPTKNGELTPEMVTSGSHKRVWWTCPISHKDVHRYVYNAVGYGTHFTQCSQGEFELANFVESLVGEGNVVRNCRSVISPYELDVYVPSKGVAIEFNGVYWHSEANGKGRHYHHGKWSQCRDAGIQLVTVWEDDWANRPDVVKSMIAHKLGVSDKPKVFARKCDIVEVDYSEASSLLESHHIQGKRAGSLYVGLKHDDELVAVAVYVKNGSSVELVRYATSRIVPGGMGRLLNYGISWAQGHGCTRLVSFSDHEVSGGNLYASLGLVNEGEIPPDYKYVQDGVRFHKSNFRKERFKANPNLIFKDMMTECELASLNGLVKVWDCGKTRWVKNI